MQQETNNIERKLKKTLNQRILAWTKSALSTSSMLLTMLITASLALHAAWPHKSCVCRSSRCAPICSPAHKGSEKLVSQCRLSTRHSEVASATSVVDRSELPDTRACVKKCVTARDFRRGAMSHEETQGQPYYKGKASSDKGKANPGAAIIERNRKATAPITPLQTGAKRVHNKNEHKSKAPNAIEK